MATPSSNLFIRLIAFGAQITTAGLYKILHPGSKMYIPGNSIPPENCTSRYRYISDMHGWRFEPICFSAGPPNAAVPVFLRGDLTCAIYQPLTYLSRVHEESKTQEMCATGPYGDNDNDANSTSDSPTWCYYLVEDHETTHLDWRFTLFLAFGLMVLVFFLYKVAIS